MNENTLKCGNRPRVVLWCAPGDPGGQRWRLDPSPRFLPSNLGLARWGPSGFVSRGVLRTLLSCCAPLPSLASRPAPSPLSPQTLGFRRGVARTSTLPRKISLLTAGSLQPLAAPGPRPRPLPHPHPPSRCCCSPPGAPHSWGLLHDSRRYPRAIAPGIPLRRKCPPGGGARVSTASGRGLEGRGPAGLWRDATTQSTLSAPRSALTATWSLPEPHP